MSRAMFYKIAALFNFSVGVPFLINPSLLYALLGSTGLPNDVYLAQLAGCLIIGFGAAYWIIGTDPQRYSPLIWVGAIAKLGVVTIVVSAALSNAAPASIAALSLMDLLFAVLFVVDARKLAKSKANRESRI